MTSFTAKTDNVCMEKTYFEKRVGDRYVLPSGSVVVLLKSDKLKSAVECKYEAYFAKASFSDALVGNWQKQRDSGATFTYEWFSKYSVAV